MRFRRVVGLLLIIAAFYTEIKAQEFTVTATKISNDSELSIDGNINESIWQKAELVTGFTQSTPFDGLPASEKTEMRVLYSNKYLYVAAIRIR